MKFYEDSLVHNPKLHLYSNEKSSDKTKQINDYLNQFILTADQMKKMKEVFIDEMKLGAMKNPPKKSSLLMMNTYITKLVDGTEIGDFLALDLGSTNFRVCHLNMNSGKGEIFDVKYYDIPENMKQGKAKPLFDHIALCVKDFLDDVLDYKKEESLPLGFTFSFPMITKSINCGLLTTWTKSYDIPEVVNNNPVEFLQNSLDEHKVKCRVDALINDAAGTLMKGIFLNKDCKLGVILGTGFNICYCENDVTRLEKWEEERLAKYKDIKKVFIDIECGAFGDTGVIDFVKTDVDFEVDNASLFPRSFSFEKMFSGKFMCEVVSRIMIKLIEKNLLLNGKLTNQLKDLKIIKTRDIQAIDSDETTKTVEELLNKLGYLQADYKIDDLNIIKYIARIITVRCACLVSPLFAAIIDWLNEPNTVIAIDGSLYKNHVLLKKLLRDYTFELTGRQKMFDIIIASDGSGKGAAIVVAAKIKSKL